MKAEILLATQKATKEYYSDPQLLNDITVEQHIADCISGLVEKLVIPQKNGRTQKYLIRYKTKDYYSDKEQWDDKKDILELNYDQLDFATIENILRENYLDSSLKHYDVWDIVLLSV